MAQTWRQAAHPSPCCPCRCFLIGGSFLIGHKVPSNAPAMTPCSADIPSQIDSLVLETRPAFIRSRYWIGRLPSTCISTRSESLVLLLDDKNCHIGSPSFQTCPFLNVQGHFPHSPSSASSHSAVVNPRAAARSISEASWQVIWLRGTVTRRCI